MKLKVILIIVTIALIPACMSSESDYNQVVLERDAYAEEYKKALEKTKLLEEVLRRANSEEERLNVLVPKFVWYPSLQTAPAPALADRITILQRPANDITSPIFQPTGVETADGRNNVNIATYEGNSYIVQSGDRLGDLALKNNTDLKTLLELNPKVKNRSNYELLKDEIIIVP